MRNFKLTEVTLKKLNEVYRQLSQMYSEEKLRFVDPLEFGGHCSCGGNCSGSCTGRCGGCGGSSCKGGFKIF